ncbi:hypothetical protein ACFU99_36335 [Streptomyces sp. NPDC057654]|uniref:hypothetical protein n=1 Tax=Streptomyces sp. NPDC057654 TaxID=3346196 RepID=UPI003697C908
MTRTKKALASVASVLFAATAALSLATAMDEHATRPAPTDTHAALAIPADEHATGTDA